MKIADSHYTPYRPASGRQSAGFDQAQIALSMPVGRPDALNPGTGGGTDRSAPSDEAEAIVFTGYPITNLSAAFWTLSADKLEKRDADAEKAAQAATAKAADKAATRDAFMDWAGNRPQKRFGSRFSKAGTFRRKTWPRWIPRTARRWRRRSPRPSNGSSALKTTSSRNPALRPKARRRESRRPDTRHAGHRMPDLSCRTFHASAAHPIYR